MVVELPWLAQLVQFPAFLPQAAPLFIGDEQTGKGIVIIDFLIKHILGELLGMSIDNPKFLVGFNGELEGKLLVNIDEMEKKDFL